MNGVLIGILVIIVLYLAFMVGVGIKFSKGNRDAGDFYLGGRKLGPFVTAMSAEASDMSSWLLMGLPGVAYLSGIADAGWTAIGLAVGTYLNWLLVARRLRRYSEKNNSITIPDFFSNRFHDKSGLLLGISAVFIVVFFIPYTASGFAACGKLFSSTFGMDYTAAMLMSAVIIVVYTALGGFLAASTTDFVQSLVMTLALIIVTCFGVYQAGGLQAVMDNAASLDGYLSMTSIHDAATGTAGGYGFITIVSTLAWGLEYFGMPHILLRFMAVKDETKLALSRRVATIWVVISMACAIFIGVVGLAMSRAGVIENLEGSGSETIIIRIATLLSTEGKGLLHILAVVCAGLILSGILASTMSTADSQLLAASSSISQNILRDIFHLKITEKANVLAARLTVVGIALVAVFMARDPDSSVFQIVSFAWAGFGAVFGPAMLFSLFWKRTGKWGVLAGMLAGGVMVFVWKYLVRPLGGVWNIYELLPAFLVACVVIVAVSLCTAAPDETIVKEFEEV